MRRYDIGDWERLRKSEMKKVFKIENDEVKRRNGRKDGRKGEECWNLYKIFEEGRRMIRREERRSGNEGRVIFKEDKGDLRKSKRIFLKKIRKEGRRLLCLMKNKGGRDVNSNYKILN